MDRDDPMARALAQAPLDDEPLTPEEQAAMARAREDIKAGRSRPWSEVRKSLP